MNYVLYGPDPSGFTRKLEAALLFYAAPFERVTAIGDARDALQQRAGTHQLPVERRSVSWRAYPKSSRRLLVERFSNQLNGSAQETVRTWLRSVSLDPLLV